jgi:hypothetical protein
MTGYNYDMTKSQKMTPDEREATRALGGIAILGGLGYLWLTRQDTPRPLGTLTLLSAGAFQERGLGSVIQIVDMKNNAKQTLVGFATNEPINIFGIHNGSSAMTALVKVTFQDGSTKSISKSESNRITEGDGAVRSSFDIDPKIDFEKELTLDGNSISEYTVTLNVSGKGQTKTVAFIVGA